MKEWFIMVENKREGPYSFLDLQRDSRITPDTLVWKKGFKEWKKARFVKELQELFKDPPKSQSLHELNQKPRLEKVGAEPATLTMEEDPFQFFLWLLLLFILFYSIYQFYYQR